MFSNEPTASTPAAPDTLRAEVRQLARNRTLIGSDGLNQLKFEVASELMPQLRGSTPESNVWPGVASDWQQMKFELAQELGVPLQTGYNGELSARDAGRLGGKIGGNMVRRLITIAEQALAGQGPAAPQ